MDPREEDFFTIKEIANKLKVCTNTVRALINSARLPALKFGHQWRVTSSDLAAYLNNTRHHPGGHTAHTVTPVKPLTGPKHHNQAIFGDDADHDDLFV